MLSPDDDVARLRAVWLGPEGHRWGWDWTYVEWAIVVVLGLAVWPLALFVLAPRFPRPWGLVVGIFGGFLIGLAAGLAARWWIAPKINPDRPFRHLAHVAIAEARRVLWARGPVDPWVIRIGVLVWLAVFLFAPLPTALRFVLACLAARPVARRLVHRFESDDRCWARHIEHLSRQAADEPYTFAVPPLETP